MGIIEVTTTSNSGAGSLREAIATAANLPGLDAIDFSEVAGEEINIANLPTIGSGNDLKFLGFDVTLNGSNSSNIFTIDGANVTFADLSLVNGLARGGNGSTGAGGGLGAGGALFINSGQVVVDNVIFAGNRAVGGNSSSGTNGGNTDSRGSAGGAGGRLNSNSLLSGGGSGGSRGTRSGNSGNPGGTGGNGEFGVGGGAGGGGGGATAGGGFSDPADDGGRGGNGGRGGFGAGGGAGGGGGKDYDFYSADEHGSGGSGASGGTFGGSGSGGSSGSNRNTGTGGGGAGLGGAVFVNSGASLTIIESRFTTNRASGGTGHRNGQGKAGAIFAMTDAEVTGANLIFTGNDGSNSSGSFAGFGTSQDNEDVYGTIEELVFPTVSVSGGNTPRESEEVRGSFAIELSSAFPIDLEIGYTIDGDATFEDDYNIPGLTLSENSYSGTVIIPAGKTNVSLDVFPTDDLFFDPRETVTINLSTGDNYQLGTTEALLTIDDDEPEVSFVADTTTIDEGTTGNVEVRLDKPAPHGGVVLNYTVHGSATPEDDYLPLVPANIFVPEGATTASIEVTALLDGNSEGNESIELTLTEVTSDAREVLNYGVNDSKDSATVTITNRDVTISPGTNNNEIVIIETEGTTDVIEGGLNDNYLVALGSKPSSNVTIDISTNNQINNITPLTFTPTNWDKFQTVKVVAVTDNLVEENHTSVITHTASSGGYQTKQLTVNIAEIIDSQDTASGLEEALTQLQAIIEDQLLSIEIPLVGSLGDLTPDFIGTFKDTVINKIATAKNLTVDALSNLLKTEIETAFSNVGIDLEVAVAANISTEEATFDVTIGNFYNLADIDLSSDLGIPALGLTIDGRAVMNFDYGLGLSFGIHDKFGFFLDTEKTELTTGVTLGLNDSFNAEGTLGLLQIDVLNNAENPTQANIEFGFTLEDLDNLPDIKFFDANNNDRLDEGEVFVEQKTDGSFDPVVVDGDTKSDAELTLLTPIDDGNRLTNDELARDDYEFSELFSPVLDGSLSLGLSSETKLKGIEALPSFSYDLAATWDAFGYEDTGAFKELGVPNISFDNLLVDLDTFISDFAKPVLEDISNVIDPIRPIIDVLNTDTKLFTALGIKNLFGKKLDTNNNNQVSLIELVAAIPGSRIATGFVDAVTKVTDLLDLIESIDSSDSEPITIDFGSFDLGRFTDDLDTDNLVATAKETVEDAIEQIERLPANNRKEVVKGFTGDPTIDIPLLTDPNTAIGLLLDQPNLTLFNYDFPELGVFLELSQNFPIFGPLSGLLQGRIDIGANLNFSFDTLGLDQWQALDYDPLESYRVFNGFFLNDLNSDGVDVPEIEFDATLAAGAGIDILALSGYLTGGIKGEIEVDLVDVGENNGTADGKVRGEEITSRLDTPWELFDIAGRVSAFLGAEVQAFRQTVYSNHFATIPLLEFNLGASGANIGVGADGYIAGGTVFFDANFNKTLDANEPFTVTNVDGTYDLDIPLYLYDVDKNNILDPKEGQIVIIDGVDISTNLPQTTPLIVIPDNELVVSSTEDNITVNTVVSPLTTLAAELSQPDFSFVKNSLVLALDLPTNINYLNYDPLAAILNGDNSDNALLVLAKTGKLQNYLFQTTQIISEASELPPEDIAVSLLEVIAERVSTRNLLDLDNLDIVKDLIDSGIEKITNEDSNLTISGAIKFVTAQTITNKNRAISATITNSELTATTKAEEIGKQILAPDISTEITQIILNPIDTVIRSLAQSKMTLAESQNIIQSSFNLPNFDLFNYDALAAIREGEERGLTIFTEQAKVQNTIVGVANFFQTQVNNPDINTANIFIEQFASNLQSLGEGERVNSPENPDAPTLLSNPVIINNLVDNVNNAISSSNLDAQTNILSSQESTNQAAETEELANVIQQNNQRIDDIVADESLSIREKAIQIARIQQLAQNADNITAQNSTLNLNPANEEIITNTANDPTKILDITNNVPVAETDLVRLNNISPNPININVLSNDSDADGDTLTITEVYTVDENGAITTKEEVTINDDGTLTYTPDADFNGEDSFYYVTTDGKGDFANAEVIIQPVELNTPIYRFQNLAVPGTYLFVGEAERANIIENFTNFVEEGFAFKVGEEASENVIPIYRFQSNITPGTYLFVGEEERAGIHANFSESFTEEGLAFYVYSAGANLGESFYRFQNSGLPGTYIFAGGTERDNILENFPGFMEEGIAFEVEV